MSEETIGYIQIAMKDGIAFNFIHSECLSVSVRSDVLTLQFPRYKQTFDMKSVLEVRIG